MPITFTQWKEKRQSSRGTETPASSTFTPITPAPAPAISFTEYKKRKATRRDKFGVDTKALDAPSLFPPIFKADLEQNYLGPKKGKGLMEQLGLSTPLLEGAKAVANLPSALARGVESAYKIIPAAVDVFAQAPTKTEAVSDILQGIVQTVGTETGLTQSGKTILGAFQTAIKRTTGVDIGDKEAQTAFDSFKKMVKDPLNTVGDVARTIHKIAVEDPQIIPLALEGGARSLQKARGEPVLGFITPAGGGVIDKLKSTASKIRKSIKDSISIKEARNQAENLANMALGTIKGKTTGSLLRTKGGRVLGLETLYEQGKGLEVTNVHGDKVPYDPVKGDFFEAAQALNKSKEKVWRQVERRLKIGENVITDTNPVVSELIKDYGPDSGSTNAAQAHANLRVSEIRKLKTPTQIRNYIKQLNPQVGRVLGGNTEAVNAEIDTKLAFTLNEALDKSLSTIKGADVRPWLDRYSRLRSIEREVVSRTNKELTTLGRGLPGYLSDFGTVDIIESVFSHNPALYIVRGTALNVFAALEKRLRDPSRFLRRTFQNIEGYADRLEPPPVKGAPRSEITPGSVIPLRSMTESSIESRERQNLKLPGTQTVKSSLDFLRNPPQPGLSIKEESANYPSPQEIREESARVGDRETDALLRLRDWNLSRQVNSGKRFKDIAKTFRNSDDFSKQIVRVFEDVHPSLDGVSFNKLKSISDYPVDKLTTELYGAQKASNAAKGESRLFDARSHYPIKDAYIIAAIEEAKKVGVQTYISVVDVAPKSYAPFTKNTSRIVYFELPEGQVSFHTFLPIEKLTKAGADLDLTHKWSGKSNSEDIILGRIKSQFTDIWNKTMKKEKS